jgi:hypothetical protein
MAKHSFWTEFFLVNVIYVVMHTFTLGFIYPMQKILAAKSLAVVGLLFFPHGVRVVAFHYLGSRAILHLLPASYLTWVTTVYGSDLDLHPLAPIASILACYLGFIMHNSINKTRTEQLLNNTWVNLLVMSGTMSTINGATLALLNFDGDFLTGVFGYLIGDIAGAFFFMVIALYIYRSIKF